MTLDYAFGRIITSVEEEEYSYSSKRDLLVGVKEESEDWKVALEHIW